MPSPRSKLYCQVRHEWVAATPEEAVRQVVLCELQGAGYPLSCLAVEKALPMLPGRRFDILAWTRNGHPFLLVECKAGSAIAARTVRQLMGYNHHIGAPWVAIAAGSSRCVVDKAGGIQSSWPPNHAQSEAEQRLS